MSLNLNQKEVVVKEVAAHLVKAQTLVMAEYRGVKVDALTILRSKARSEGVYLRVIKNSLARRAVEGTQFSGVANEMTGPLIYSISVDPVAAAKVVNDFAKTNDKLVIRGGNYAGKNLDAAAVKALASIPGREQLLAMLLGVMQSPTSAFARGLAALAAQKAEAAA